jgi:hypothetical protein
MNLNSTTWWLVLLFLWGCNGPDKDFKVHWQKINGRSCHPVYRALVPAEWTRHDPDKDSVADTTQPLVEYRLSDGIVITVHNFPGIRIPPAAQIARWRGQMKDCDPKCMNISSCSHGGFAGLQFECKNCLAWAMQLDAGHRQKLPGNQNLHDEMKADYTIKAVGPHEKLSKHRREIHDFAMSFELIQEIPR